MCNFYGLSCIAGKDKYLGKITLAQCKLFLYAYANHCKDVELNLDDLIETFRNNKTSFDYEAYERYISCECILCYQKCVMSKVNAIII